VLVYVPYSGGVTKSRKAGLVWFSCLFGCTITLYASTKRWESFDFC
jgi:hypothetical protein